MSKTDEIVEERPFPDIVLWDILREEGALEDELIAEYRQRVSEMPWLPLGRILIERRVISVAKVMELLALQAAEPDLLLGALAVREGLCTLEQIEACLEIQRNRSPSPIDFLLHDSRVDREGLVEALAIYVKHLEGRLMKGNTELGAIAGSQQG